jgi:NADH-quinone oxidoreductase subunit N
VTGWLALAGLAVASLPLLRLAGVPAGDLLRPGRDLARPGRPAQLPACSYVVDNLALVFQVVVLAGAAVVVLLAMDTVRDERLPAGEHWFLLLCSVTGALVLPAARDVLTLMVALETVSLPTYALVGLRRGARSAPRRR